MAFSSGLVEMVGACVSQGSESEGRTICPCASSAAHKNRSRPLPLPFRLAWQTPGGSWLQVEFEFPGSHGKRVFPGAIDNARKRQHLLPGAARPCPAGVRRSAVHFKEHAAAIEEGVGDVHRDRKPLARLDFSWRNTKGLAVKIALYVPTAHPQRRLAVGGVLGRERGDQFARLSRQQAEVVVVP